MLSAELEGFVSSIGTAVVAPSAPALVASWDSSDSFLLSIVLNFLKTKPCPVVRISSSEDLFLGNANGKPVHLEDT